MIVNAFQAIYAECTLSQKECIESMELRYFMQLYGVEMTGGPFEEVRSLVGMVQVL